MPPVVIAGYVVGVALAAASRRGLITPPRFRRFTETLPWSARVEGIEIGYRNHQLVASRYIQEKS